MLLSPFNPLRSSNAQRPTADQTPPKSSKKAASFRNLSVCESRCLPSRTPSRRGQNKPSCTDSTRSPWLSPSRRRRSSLTNVEPRVKSFRASSSCLAGPAATSSVPGNPNDPPSEPSSSIPTPTVSTLSRTAPDADPRQVSFSARARRTPSVSRYPKMHIDSSPNAYTMQLALPSTITSPEMVTISTAKGDKLRIVADAWHLESDCHYEWEVAFPAKDVNMSSIRAKFDGKGRLSVEACRY
uniref:SHSP domain-containing protein n=1 Tax=Mycena chlorophos TaxID=658473 RepID=A0ABQ0KZT8_MYCCL|nr:predicted protein [Mycena chlorophos]